MAATQVDRSQRRQIVGVDKVGRMHSRVSKLRAEHLTESVARQPREEGRWYSEAA